MGRTDGAPRSSAGDDAPHRGSSQAEPELQAKAGVDDKQAEDGGAEVSMLRMYVRDATSLTGWHAENAWDATQLAGLSDETVC